MFKYLWKRNGTVGSQIKGNTKLIFIIKILGFYLLKKYIQQFTIIFKIKLLFIHNNYYRKTLEIYTKRFSVSFAK